MEPPVSVPSANGANSAPTAAAEPPLDPPGTRSRSHGLRVGKYAEFSVDEPMANSSMLALPSSTVPASARRRVMVASSMGTKFSRIFEPAVVRMPRVVSTSLRIIGMPSSGCVSPLARRSSARRACSSATSRVTVNRLRTVDSSTASMRSRCARATSSADTSRWSRSSRSSRIDRDVSGSTR